MGINRSPGDDIRNVITFIRNIGNAVFYVLGSPIKELLDISSRSRSVGYFVSRPLFLFMVRVVFDPHQSLSEA